MKIRKFNCPTCGAAKVNPYKTPFVCCDYCGEWIDFDTTLWIDIYSDGKRLNKKEELDERILAKTRKALNENKRELYFFAQQDYFNSYYNIYPEFVPPSIGKGERFRIFLRQKAEWATDLHFHDTLHLKKKKNASNKAIQNLSSPKEPHIDFFASFIQVAQLYHQYLQQEVKVKKENSKYDALMNVYPENFDYKMKMGLFLNPWLSRLTEIELQHFQKKYGLHYEWVDVVEPEKIQAQCNHCAHPITAPKGAIRGICENCNELSVLVHQVNCSNCGAQNTIPETRSVLINCNGCGTEIRIVRLL